MYFVSERKEWEVRVECSIDSRVRCREGWKLFITLRTFSQPSLKFPCMPTYLVIKRGFTNLRGKRKLEIYVHFALFKTKRISRGKRDEKNYSVHSSLLFFTLSSLLFTFSSLFPLCHLPPSLPPFPRLFPLPFL